MQRAGICSKTVHHKSGSSKYILIRGASKDAYALIAQALLGAAATDDFSGQLKREKKDYVNIFTYPLPANIANLGLKSQMYITAVCNVMSSSDI